MLHFSRQLGLPREVFLGSKLWQRISKTIGLKIRNSLAAACSGKVKQTKFMVLNLQFDICRINEGIACQRISLLLLLFDRDLIN